MPNNILKRCLLFSHFVFIISIFFLLTESIKDKSAVHWNISIFPGKLLQSICLHGFVCLTWVYVCLFFLSIDISLCIYYVSLCLVCFNKWVLWEKNWPIFSVQFHFNEGASLRWHLTYVRSVSYLDTHTYKYRSLFLCDRQLICGLVSEHLQNHRKHNSEIKSQCTSEVCWEINICVKSPKFKGYLQIWLCLHVYLHRNPVGRKDQNTLPSGV